MDSSERERVLRRLSVRGGYSWGLISGLEDQRVDVDVDVDVLEVEAFVREARVMGLFGATVGDVTVISIEGRALMDQDWSSLSRSYGWG